MSSPEGAARGPHPRWQVTTFAVGSASPAMVDAYKRCRDYLDEAISLVKPGNTTADVTSVFPKAEEFGFPNEEAAFALQLGHGVGLSIWKKPVFSRLVSIEHPETIEEGMVFALETFWPASDGWSAARIEEQMVVTKDGCEVITRFPAEKLLIAGRRYYAAMGPLETPGRLSRTSTATDGSARWWRARGRHGRHESLKEVSHGDSHRPLSRFAYSELHSE